MCGVEHLGSALGKCLEDGEHPPLSVWVKKDLGFLNRNDGASPEDTRVCSEERQKNEIAHSLPRFGRGPSLLIFPDVDFKRLVVTEGIKSMKFQFNAVRGAPKLVPECIANGCFELIEKCRPQQLHSLLQ